MKKVIKSKLETNKIVIDEELYPRNQHSWQKAYEYSEGMKTGTVFPRVVVAKWKNVFLLVDGRHRLEAIKICLGRKDYRKAKVDVEVLTGLSKAEIFKEAVKRNVKHGLGMNVQEKIKASLKLKEFNFSPAEISKIVQVPLTKLTNLQARKVTNTITGEEIVLKKDMEHLGSKPLPARLDDIDFVQNAISGGAGQPDILKEFLVLLKSKTLDLKNPKVKSLLKQIKIELKKF